jgi:hypothetical protein
MKQKIKLEQYEPHYKTGMDSDVPERHKLDTIVLRLPWNPKFHYCSTILTPKQFSCALM